MPEDSFTLCLNRSQLEFLQRVLHRDAARAEHHENTPDGEDRHNHLFLAFTDILHGSDTFTTYVLG